MTNNKRFMNNTDTPINEREIVLRLIDGDEDAFCELYATYKNRLLYFAMRFVKSRDFAEDIFQDAFTVIWQGRRFIDPNASFSSYLYTIMRNRILNQIRNMEKEDTLKESILSQAIIVTQGNCRQTWHLHSYCTRTHLSSFTYHSYLFNQILRYLCRFTAHPDLHESIIKVKHTLVLPHICVLLM